MQIDVILFDWGGTLAEVAGQAEALREGAVAAGRLLDHDGSADHADQLVADVLAAEIRAAADSTHREANLLAVLADWASSAGMPTDPDRLAEAAHLLGQTWVGCLDPIPGVADAIRSLRQAGRRTGLVSNCSVPPEYCRQEFDRQGLTDVMDFAVFSSEVGYRKPAEVIYAKAIERAGSEGRPADPSTILFVGDSPALDVIAPAAMGMRTALVSRPPGAWPADDYERARPDFRIDHVSELIELLGDR
jgi:FMN phosphatase YigB (HAD superfamily)